MSRNDCFDQKIIQQIASIESRGTFIYFMFFLASAQNFNFADICKKLVVEARSLTALSNIRGCPAEIFTDLETRISV